MSTRRLTWVHVTAVSLLAAVAYSGLALRGRVPGGWRLRTLVQSSAEIAEAGRQAHRRERLATFAKEQVAPGGVLFIGSSTIEFFDLAVAFPGANAVNRGIGDEDLAGLEARLENTLSSTGCAAVVLYAGSVDFRRHESAPSTIASGVSRLLDGVEETLPGARVLLLGILPERGMSAAMGARLRATNAALEALSGERDRVSFVSTARPPVTQGGSGALEPTMSRDQVHLNEGGYKEATAWLLEADEEVARWLQR